MQGGGGGGGGNPMDRTEITTWGGAYGPIASRRSVGIEGDWNQKGKEGTETIIGTGWPSIPWQKKKLGGAAKGYASLLLNNYISCS